MGQANVSKHLKILAQAGIVARTQKGINVYYQISNPFVFDLCDLVCNSLSIQIQQQHEQLRQIQKCKITKQSIKHSFTTKLYLYQ